VAFVEHAWKTVREPGGLEPGCFTSLYGERHTAMMSEWHARGMETLSEMEPMMMTVEDELLNRAKQEYLEMPGLVLTSRQASRLWNLDAVVCQALLSALVHEAFLSETQDGAYLRRGSGRRRVRADQPEPTHPGGPDDRGDEKPVNAPTTAEQDVPPSPSEVEIRLV
jgi:hypothetical protein